MMSTLYQYPCEVCGADVGQRCADWCLEAADGEPTPHDDLDLPAELGPHDRKARGVSAQHHLHGRLALLTLAAGLPEPPYWDEQSDEDYLDAVAEWIDVYAQQVADYVGKANEDKLRLLSMEVQRSALRQLIGVPA